MLPALNREEKDETWNLFVTGALAGPVGIYGASASRHPGWGTFFPFVIASRSSAGKLLYRIVREIIGDVST